MRDKYPLVAEAALWIGHTQIRNRGTVGGSLVHGDPTAELALIAVLLEAQITVRKEKEIRTVGPDDFFVGVMTTGIEVDEMLTEVAFPNARRVPDTASESSACGTGTSPWWRQLYSLRRILRAESKKPGSRFRGSETSLYGFVLRRKL